MNLSRIARAVRAAIACNGGVFGNGTIQTANVANGAITQLKLSSALLASLQNNGFQLLGTIAGTANAVTANASPAIAAYAAGQRWQITPTSTNTAALVIAINGLANRAVKKRISGGLADLVAGDWVSANTYQLVDDGTQLVLEGASAAGLVLIQRQVVAAAAQCDFTGIDGTYDEYVVKISQLVTTDQLQLRMSTDGGATYKAGATDYAYAVAEANTAATTGQAGSNPTGAAQMFLCDAGLQICGDVTLYQPADTTGAKVAKWHLASFVGVTASVSATGTGAYRGTTNAVNGIRFKGNSGNISGTFALYGVRKT